MTGRRFDKETHQRILLQLLIDISKGFGSKLGFKGGTCGHIFYDLPRISVDLDFDVLSPFSRKETDELKIIIGKYGKIKDYYEKHFTCFFLFSYGSGSPNVKIELNKRLWKSSNYKPVWLLGVEIKIADEATLFANKLVALTERKQAVARDLFDAYYFMKMKYPINLDLLQERTGKSLTTYLAFLKSYIQKNFARRNILFSLGELLEERQKDWARENLLKEIIEEIEKLIAENR